ncbi:MAG: aromatic ring hydroxylase [Alphaproteobacteria bacterium]|nr:aromatic ring hydroxylase [Alphaproteobacteria bacterium]MBU0793544.1 aromatic ring hydroxylase [Alphaproteobacteria bacterium]MBU0876394.1 aromatic ring hydroxylase [Alphaproteobacteria bacterium]MBU1770949.1 aromatic ring hydroxylase [Alphaproteobacteria bacterium]
MAVRNGKQYKAALDDGRVVWLGEGKVNVATDPGLAGSIDGMAGYFDWQIDYADECLVDDPEKPGEKMNVSLMLPKSKEDLKIRHRGLERLARYSNGMLGRTPDYVNVVLSGHTARADIWAKGKPEGYERLKNFHREVIDGDLSMTHTIVHANIDKGAAPLAGMNSELTLRVVGRNENGIIVRGGKVLATLGPLADELYVYSSMPIPSGAEEYALIFSVPVNTKGVIQICRDHYGTGASVADAPFSSRFDEQDAFVIFDDVEVPYERLFCDGDLNVYNNLNQGVSPGNTLQQTAIRAMVKLEFAYDLCSSIAKITNSLNAPDVAVQLGEIHSYLSLTRSAIIAAEERAHDWGAGAVFPHRDLSVLRCVMPGWMTRVNQIIRAIGSHNLLCTPSLALFDDPEIGGLLRKYLPGSNGIAAEDRARIMRMAWDFAGSALGSRVELYEMFYLTSQTRARIGDHMTAQRDGEWGQVREFMQKSGILPG